MAGDREDLGFNIFALDKASKTLLGIAGVFDKLSKKVDELDRKKVDVPVDVDTTVGAKKIDDLTKDLDELDRARPEATVDVETKAATDNVIDITDRLDRFGRERAEATADVETTTGKNKLRSLNEGLDTLGRKKATATADVETAVGTAKKHKLEENLEEFGRIKKTAEVDVDTDSGRRSLLSFSGVWSKIMDKTRLDIIRSQLTLDKFASSFGRKIRLFVLAGVGAIVAAIIALPPLAVLAAGAIVTAFGGGLAAIGIGFAATNDKVKKSFNDLKDHVFKVMKEISKPFIDTLLAIAGIAGRTFDRLTPKLAKSFELMAPHVTRFAGFFAAAFEELGRAFVPMSRAFNAILDVLGPILRSTFSDIADELIIMARWVRKNKEEVGELVGFLLGLIPRVLHLITVLAEHWRNERKAFIDAWDSQVVKDFKATFEPIVRDIADLVRKHWGAISTWVRKNLGIVEDIIREVLGIIRVLWRHWGDDIMFIVERVFGGIAEAIEGNLQVVRGVFRIIGGLLRGDWKQVWAGIKDIAIGALKIVHGAVKAVFGALTGIVRIAMHSVRDIVLGVWNQIKGGVRTALDAVKSAVRTAWDAVKTATRTVWDAVVTVVRSKWDAIKTVFRTALDVLKTVVRTAWDAIKTVFRTVFDAVVTVVRSRWDIVKTVFRTAFDTVKTVTRTAMDAVRDKVSDVLGRIRTAFGNAKDGIERIWNGIKRVAAAPINFVITWVYNRGIKKVVDAIPGVDNLPEVDTIPTHRRGGRTAAGPLNKIVGGVHANEFVINAESTAKIDRASPGLLERLNATGRLWQGLGGERFQRGLEAILGYAKGGRVADRFVEALRWAKRQVGDVYGWGDEGPNSWDCSGFMSGIANKIRGGSGYGVRYGSTASFPWSGFRAGPGAFTIGSTPNYGGSGVGHMAGTLLGVNVESSGGVGVRVGGGARGYNDPHFTQVAHIGPGGTFGSAAALGALAIGKFDKEIGSVGSGVLGAFDAVPDVLNWLAGVKDKVDSMMDRGAWWNMLGKAMRSLLPGFKDWALDQLKDAGAWTKDLSVNVFGQIGQNAHDAWETIKSPFGLDYGGTLRPGWNRVYNGTGTYEHLTPDSRAARGSGIHIEHLEVKALGDKFDLNQVMDSLAWQVAG